MSVARSHTHCRVCGTELPPPYLDLGCQPLANALIHMDRDWGRRVPKPDLAAKGETLSSLARSAHSFSDMEQWTEMPSEFSAPLAVTLCRQCGLSQLTVVVDPEILYSGYRFRSGASAEWRTHCDALAEKAGRPGRMLDIAANDGTCLDAFWARGWSALGVDPAPAAAGIMQGFWPCDAPGTFDIIVAQNVLGHVDRPVEFLAACEQVLTPDGFLVVEVPYVRDLIWNCAFDTIYHEHLSYWGTRPMLRAAHQAGLTLHHSERIPTHGGSHRYWFRRGKSPVSDRPVYDIPVFDLPYAKFATDVERRLLHVIRELKVIEQSGQVLGAYGASAKGAVMLNALKDRGNTVWPVSIVDDVPEKQGMLSPGLHLPIKSMEEAGVCEWDVAWILSWNWKEQLTARLKAYGFKGEFFVTHPDVVRG